MRKKISTNLVLQKKIIFTCQQRVNTRKTMQILKEINRNVKSRQPSTIFIFDFNSFSILFKMQVQAKKYVILLC